jgi:hypothetical protein
LTVTTAASSRKDATKVIHKHAPHVELLKIEMHIATLMAKASEHAGKARSLEGEPLRVIVARIVTLDFAPAYRTPGGFFSESRGQEIRRQDFVTFTPSHLIEAAGSAIDIPRNDNGDPMRTALLKAVQTELTIMFADLMRTMPPATEAKLMENSAAAGEFRNAVIRVLTTPNCWQLSREDGNTHRASLISRAADQIRAVGGVNETKEWRQVINAVNLWWRKVATASGELATLLAMRWELFHQMKIMMPTVHDQESFVSLGTRYGVIDPAPPTSSKTQHGTRRIAVLRQEFVAPLLGDAGLIADTE